MAIQRLLGAIRPVVGACALSMLASVASAASYNMTILSGTYDADYFFQRIVTPLAGQSVSFTVTDDFQNVDIDYGHGFYYTQFVKTMTFQATGVLSAINAFKYYSEDGTHFERWYNGASVGSQFSADIELHGQSLTFYSSNSSVNGEFKADFIAAVPVPPAFGLFAVSLVGLGASRLRRRRK